MDISNKAIKRKSDITVRYFFEAMKEKIHIELLTKNTDLEKK